MKRTRCVTISAIALAASHAVANEAEIVGQSVSEQEVLASQQGWCNASVDISTTHAEDGRAAAKALAEQVIDAAYGYQMSAVLFKPTLTVNPQTFRTTRAGALSYFVGGDSSFPSDTGFALKNWAKCEAEKAAIFITGRNAVMMGKAHFTDKDGNMTSADMTWRFIKDDAGSLRIVLHHSSLEHQPK